MKALNRLLALNIIMKTITNFNSQANNCRLPVVGRSWALALVAGRTEKPGGVDPAKWFENDAPDCLYACGDVPLQAFVTNEDPMRYDGTVDLQRAQSYASLQTAAPPVLASFGRRNWVLRILDGGHRISAARMNKKESIYTVLRIRREKAQSLLRIAKDQSMWLCWQIGAEQNTSVAIDQAGSNHILRLSNV